jgi:hypothetical protein
MRRNVTMTPPMTIRQSEDTDIAQLWRLAQLDSAPLLEGPALLAEYDGRAVAAVSLDGERAIADPFEPTQGIVTLLRTWAGQLRSS